ncbi:P4 alpha zinc-binding domain-containing protein [Martelella sp. HB161492]|uniref:P4 alpha zinc-binding domain-containing protein n=1 Tax=Martelella sp. HB161492 TaxID=2720726 RepID=UPI0015901CFD|nr:P4 alpha zinc-binding domain-containing protein [Martelella sp. HB161492]
MTELIEAFVEEARAVSLAVAAVQFSRMAARGAEWTGACPVMGGKDAYAVNVVKGVWNCRKCGAGGHDAISLAAHECGFDLSCRSGFLGACAEVLGRPVPDGAGEESEAERAAREARLAKARAEAEERAALADKRKQYFRERAMHKARGIYFGAALVMPGEGLELREYLRLRTGHDMPEAVFESIRCDLRHTYWHGVDPFGRPAHIYTGTAMIAPFIDLTGKVYGCHETWIDLEVEPKRRPVILDEDGVSLPTKKMQGLHKGMLIPVLGDLRCCRWVVAEGIENVAAVAGLERFRDDTFYCAAGSLGNLAGPAASKEKHPSEKRIDKRGFERPVFVDGPLPKADADPASAFQVPDHVDDLVLIADGDSERLMTAFAMKRAELRLSAPGRVVTTDWPPQGAGDFSELCMELVDG